MAGDSGLKLQQEELQEVLPLGAGVDRRLPGGRGGFCERNSAQPASLASPTL